MDTKQASDSSSGSNSPSSSSEESITPKDPSLSLSSCTSMSSFSNVSSSTNSRKSSLTGSCTSSESTGLSSMSSSTTISSKPSKRAKSPAVPRTLKSSKQLKTAKTLSTTSVTSLVEQQVPTLCLRTYREDYFMPLSTFLKFSTQTLGENFVLTDVEKSDKTENENLTIALYEYDVQAVRALADFVQAGGHTNMKVPPSALLDLLELSELFCIHLLTQSVHNWILQSAAKSISQLAHALQLLSDPHVRACSTGGKLFSMALTNFRNLPQAHTFINLSPSVLVEILDACELPAKTEVEVFEIVLRYLHRRNDRLLIAYELVSCVRQSRISDVYRRWMVDALGRLPQGDQLKAIVAMVINEENSFRSCVLSEHKNLVRCGELPKEVRGCRFTIFSNKIDLEGVSPVGSTEQDHPYKTRSGRIFINREIPKKSYRGERRALREVQRLKDEQVNKRILAGLEK